MLRPAGISWTMRRNCAAPSTRWPLISVTTSFSLRPALAAGLSGTITVHENGDIVFLNERTHFLLLAAFLLHRNGLRSASLHFQDFNFLLQLRDPGILGALCFC